MALVLDITAVVRFDNVGGGAYQRVFDFSNGATNDEILFGNAGTTDTITLSTIQNGHAYRVRIPDAITNGETNTWRVTIDDQGEFQVFKDGTLISDMSEHFSVVNFSGQDVTPDTLPTADAVPNDVPRSECLVGESPFWHDADLIGEVSSLQIDTTLANGFDLKDVDALDDVESFSGTHNSEETDATGNVDGINIAARMGDDTVTGGIGNDTIDSGWGNDSLQGGLGNDFLAGNLGDDTIEAGDGNDTIWGGEGDDSASGGSGDDEIVDGVGDDTIDGGAGNDNVRSGGGADKIDAGSGDDTIAGGAGCDTVDGGEGNDLIQEDAGLHLGHVTALMGGAWASGYISMEVPDHIGDGDTFWMTRVGGNPAKPLKVKAVKVEVTEHENGDVSLRALAAKYHPDTAQYNSYEGDFDSIQNMMETGGVAKPVAIGPWHNGYGIYNVSINEGEVTNTEFLPTSSPGLLFDRDPEDNADSLAGGAGDDTIEAGLGEDTVDGGTDDDVISGGEGNDSIAGGFGNDTISGGDGDDFIAGDTFDGDAPSLKLNSEGTSGILSVENVSEFPTDQLSYQLEFSIDTPDSNFVPLASYAVHGSNNEFLVEINNGNLGIVIAGDHVPTGVDVSGLMDGGTHSLTLNWDSESGQVNVYADGSQIFTGTIATGESIQPGGTFVLGQEQDSVGGSFDSGQILSGDIYGAKLFGDVKSPAEIEETESDDANLVADWTPAGDGSGMRDASGKLDLNASGDVKTTDLPMNDSIDGGAGNDTIHGGAGDDSIIGGDGADSIEGGQGSDTLSGGEGDDFIAGDAIEVQSSVSINASGSDGVLTAENIGDFPSTKLSYQIEFSCDDHDGNYIPLGSYASSEGSHNEFLVGIRDGALRVWIGGKFYATDANVDNLLDGEKHELTINWDSSTGDLNVFSDGDLIKTKTIAKGESIESDGTFVLGQEQDEVGGRFDHSQIFSGKIYGAKLLNDVKSPEEINAAENSNSMVANWVPSETGMVDAAGNHDLEASGNVITQDGPMNDFIDAGSGDDTVIGGAGNDTILGADGADSIEGGQGSDSIDGGVGNDSIDGGIGDDWIASGDDDDYVSGGSGNDTIFAGIGNDFVDGGDGNDSVQGVAGDNTILGGAGNDTILGADGADSIEGGQGSDTLHGGQGDDVIYGDSARTENAGFENVGGEGSENISGWTNQASGSQGIVETWGEVRGGWQNLETSDGGGFIELDWFGAHSGHGTDHITTDVDLSSGENFTIKVDAAARSGFQGESFEITFNGEVVGTFTPETTDTFTEFSVTVTGTDGQDTLGFRELASENQGAGILLDNVQIELTEYEENEFDDSIAGGAGADRIYGQEGNDTIDGGLGSDTLTGGTGRDTFVIGENSGTDLVSDFELPVEGVTNSGDRLDISELTGGSGPNGSMTLADVQIGDDGNGNAEIGFPGGETVVLFGVSPSYFDSKKKFAGIGIPCFVDGTMIETQRGLIAVDDLCINDSVISPTGTQQEIAWIGKRVITHAELVSNAELRPIWLRTGAIGNTAPLWVSPQHAFVVGNYLVRAKLIAEFCGPRIARRDERIETITYFHVFLREGHGMVMVNGAVSETLWPGSRALRSLGAENVLNLIAAHPNAFSIGKDQSSSYPGPCYPYASKTDIRSGRVTLLRGHAVNLKSNKRLHQYSDRQERIGESWFI